MSYVYCCVIIGLFETNLPKSNLQSEMEAAGSSGPSKFLYYHDACRHIKKDRNNHNLQ
jgi:hypothetical protein